MRLNKHANTMIGLKNRRLLILLFLGLCSCNPHQVNTRYDETNHHDSKSYDKDLEAMRRSVGETEIKRYADYDFYLLYVRGGAWQVSSFYSLMLKESVLYSYTKYLDNIVSIKFPPRDIILGKDSFFYSVTYQEHRMEQLDTLIKKMEQVGYWSNNVWDNFMPGETVSYLFVYLKNKGEFRLRSNVSTYTFNDLVVKYVKDTFMRYLPEIDKKLYRTKIKL